MNWITDNWVIFALLGLYGLEQIAKRTKTKLDDRAVKFIRGAVRSVTTGITGTFNKINGKRKS